MEIVPAVKFGDQRLPEEFWSRVQQQSTGCWEWIGSLLNTGYGQWRRGESRLAHRTAYTTLIAPIPDGLQVRHSCDNPPCVNPAHLLLGTAAENAADKMERGRHRSGKRERHGMSKLTERDVEGIRTLSARGASQASLAVAYGISQQHVSKVIRGIYWPAA